MERCWPSPPISSAAATATTFSTGNVLGAWLPLTVFVAAGLAARRAGLLGGACLAAVLAWSVVVYVDVATSPELQRDDWRAVGKALPAGQGLVAIYPADQSAALMRQRPDLVEGRRAAETDTIALVLVGFDEPPASFLVPHGFAERRRDAIQHFTVVEYRADRRRALAPEDVASGPLEDSDLAVLAAER